MNGQPSPRRAQSDPAGPWRAAAVAAVMLATGCLLPDAPEPVWVTIPRDAALTAVAESLETHGIVRSATSFRWYASWTRKAGEFKPGVYDLRPDLHLAEVTNALVAGVAPLDSIVIPPSVTLDEALPLFDRQLGFDTASVREAVSTPHLIERAGASGSTMEGYLYPGKYFVRRGESPHQVIERMVDAFERHWEPDWNRRLAAMSMSRHEIVTLASIIEAEVRLPVERGLVSSVYHNRLSAGMRLQADPTVVYALGERRRLTYEDYEIDSPYNTYRIDGLPPHPVGQPTSASIEAALFPDSTEFLYFVAGLDGKHTFSRTYEDHLEAVRLRDEGALGR